MSEDLYLSAGSIGRKISRGTSGLFCTWQYDELLLKLFFPSTIRANVLYWNFDDHDTVDVEHPHFPAPSKAWGFGQQARKRIVKICEIELPDLELQAV